MIQRIQTIYLALAAAGFGLLYVFPFATSPKPVTQYMKDLVYNINDHILLQALTILGIVLFVGAIFLFKNRPLQQRLSVFATVCAILVPLTAILLMLTDPTPKTPDTDLIEEKLGIAIPIIPIIFGILAFRGIKKDDKLVRSMDRLR